MIAATVMTRESTDFTDREYAYGSGLINPMRAVHPGLVYDIEAGRLIGFSLRANGRHNSEPAFGCNAAARLRRLAQDQADIRSSQLSELPFYCGRIQGTGSRSFPEEGG